MLDDDATLVPDSPVPRQETATQVPTASSSKTFADSGSPTTSGLGNLRPGMSLGGRYEIVKLLGEGGMGAVYKAHDVEVDRVVALKVIRPEYANRPEILGRFKQELVLARQITHKNVIRIFDLGQADGIRFITMEFVRGQDLHSLLTDGRPFTIEEKVRMVREICYALDAAHAEGVIHRDLKPHNVMIENGGRAVVMDFGIARSTQDSGITSTGALIGTPAYMSPEQAKGEKIDTRSDLFSMGVIFYELLTGRAPYESETTVGMLLKRVQEQAVPPAELDKEIPAALSEIVVKCLVTNREGRYQTAKEVIRDLNAWLEDPSTFRPSMTGVPEPAAQNLTIAGGRTIHQTVLGQTVLNQLPADPAAVETSSSVPAASHAWKWIALSIMLAMVVAGGVFWGSHYFSKPAGPVAPLTMMISDFNNHTGDPVFGGTLESALKLAMEGATFINAYDRTRMRDLGLPAVAGALDESSALKIAVAQGLNVVVSGSVERRASGYQLSLRAVQAVTGKVIANPEETASSKDQVLFAVTKLAGSVRKALGDASSDSAQRFSMETLSAASLEAVHEYALALDALSNGKNDEAQRRFSQAVDLDPNFGLAYAGMASASHNLGRPQDAEKYINQAIRHIDQMTERERFRTRAFLYLLRGDEQKCVDEYGTLLARYSSDTGAANNMAVCLTQLRNLPKALEEVRHAISILPKRATYHVNLSLYSSYSGDFQTAAKEAAKASELNPAYAAVFQAMAFASLGQDQPAQAAQAYGKLEKIRPSDAAIGQADLAVYEGRFGDAVSILQKNAAADVAAHRPDAASDKFALLAYTELLRQHKEAAIKEAGNALDLSKAAKTRFATAQIFAAAGDTARAQQLAAGLGAELQIEPQAYAKLIEGEIAIQKGEARQAIKYITEANNLLDTWMGRFDLGRAYLEAGQFTEADSEFDRCLKRRGETLALFLDEVPTYGYFPPVYYYQGRAREGMKSIGFAEAYKKYLSIRGRAQEDPLLAEIHRRAGN